MGMGGPSGGSSQPESYAAATEFTADDAQSGETYVSTGSDASGFYGVGAAALVTDGTLKISDSIITTDATADSWSDYAVDKA